MPHPSTLLFLLSLALPATDACPPCATADSLLVRGDTAAAAEALRRAAIATGAPEVWAELAWVLTLRARPGESGSEDRMEAERALERAEGALPDDVRWLFARGILLAKRGTTTDMRRVLARAVERLVVVGGWSSASRGSLFAALAAQLPAEEYDRVLVAALAALEAAPSTDAPGLARFLVTLAQVQERRVWPTRHLASRYDRFVAERLCTDAMPCPSGGEVAVTAAAVLSEAGSGSATSDPLDERLIGRLYARAFAADPALDAAARGHLGELARAGDWSAFLAAARRHEAAELVGEARGMAGAGGWAGLFVATGLHAQLRHSEADSAFDAALERLEPGERAFVEDISMSLRPEHQKSFLDLPAAEARGYMSRWLLHVSDPLFLTPWNERRLAHLSRVVLAELWFGEPWNGLRGARTDRGLILVRYGEPTRVWRMEGTPTEAVSTLAGCDRPRPTCMWDETTVGIRWNYDRWGRDFLFLKSLKERTVLHSPRSAEAARELGDIEPSNLDFRVEPIPHQVARFLGRSAPVDVDVHLALPFDSTMEVRRPGRAALFFLPRSPLEELTPLQTEVPLGWAPGTTTFRFEMATGSYVYAAEAMTGDHALRAASRDILEITAFEGSAPMLSDLLLARSVAHEGPEPPRTRHDLRIRPAADLLYRPGEPVALYFEVYHLRERDETVRYRVELEVKGGERRGILARAVRGLTELVAGADESGRIRWERTMEPIGDRVPEWFRLEMPGAPEGSYRVSVTVTDLNTGRRATAGRQFRVGARYDPLAEW